LQGAHPTTCRKSNDELSEFPVDLSYSFDAAQIVRDTA